MTWQININWSKYLIFLLIPTFTQALGTAQVEMESYRHEYNPDIFKMMTLNLVNFTDHCSINGSVMLSRNLNNIMVTYSGSVPKGQGNAWTLFNVTTSACRLLDEGYRKSLNLPYMLLNILKSKSVNFPQKCPVKMGQEISFFDIYFDTEKYPIIIPDIKFDVLLSMKSRDVFLYKAYMSIAIVSKGKKKKDV